MPRDDIENQIHDWLIFRYASLKSWTNYTRDPARQQVNRAYRYEPGFYWIKRLQTIYTNPWFYATLIERIRVKFSHVCFHSMFKHMFMTYIQKERANPTHCKGVRIIEVPVYYTRNTMYLESQTLAKNGLFTIYNKGSRKSRCPYYKSTEDILGPNELSVQRHGFKKTAKLIFSQRG